MSPDVLDSLLQGMAQGWFLALDLFLLYLRLLVPVVFVSWLFGLGGLLWMEWRQTRNRRGRGSAAIPRFKESRNILLWRVR